MISSSPGRKSDSPYMQLALGAPLSSAGRQGCLPHSLRTRKPLSISLATLPTGARGSPEGRRGLVDSRFLLHAPFPCPCPLLIVVSPDLVPETSFAGFLRPDSSEFSSLAFSLFPLLSVRLLPASCSCSPHRLAGLSSALWFTRMAAASPVASTRTTSPPLA